MSNTKISALTSATTPLAGTETLPIVQSSTTKQVSVANLTAGRAVSSLSYTSTTGATFATTSGNVSIGTGTASYKLDVYTGVAGDMQRWNTGSVSMLVSADHLGTGNWFLSPQVTATFNIKTNAVTRFTVNSTGDILVSTGNIIPSTAAKGINFTANTPAAGMTSQLLNWYEQGTWTPTVSFTTPGDLAVVYSVQQGTYIRVGNLVTINFRLNTSTFTFITASGAMVLSGLPFTSIGVAPSRGSVKIDGWNMLAISTMGVEVPINTATMNIYVSRTAASSATLNNSNFTTGTNIGIWGTVSYITS